MFVLPLVASLLAQSPPTLEERQVIAAEKTAEALQKLAELEAAEAAKEAAATAKPAEAPAAAPAPAPSPWSGGLSLGFTYLTGNSNSITFSGAGNIQRKTDRWIYGAKVWGAFGQTTSGEGLEEVVAFNAGILGQVDLRLHEKVSILVAGGVDTDHVKAVELRGYGEVGVGILWIDQKVEDYQKLMLKTDVTFRVGSEGRYNYYPAAAAPCWGRNKDGDPEVRPLGAADFGDQWPSCAATEGGGGSVLQVAPRAALAFKYSLTKSVFFTDDFEIMPTVAGSLAGRLILNNNAKLNVRVIANFGLSASWSLKFDSKPATGKKELDNAVIGAVDLTF